MKLIVEQFTLLTEFPENVRKLKPFYLELASKGKLEEQNIDDKSVHELIKKIELERQSLIKQKKIGKKAKVPPVSIEEIPFEIPKNWNWKRLADVTINWDGYRVPVSKIDREKRKGKYDYYGASGVIDKIDDFLYDGDFLLIGEDGANLITRSKPVAFLASGKFWVNNHAHVLGSLDKTLLKYLEIYLNSISLEPFITGGFQPKLSQKYLNLIPVPFPPYEEQERIVKAIEKIFPKVDELVKIESENIEVKT